MNLDPTNLVLFTTKTNRYCQENCSSLLINKERVFYDRLSSGESSLENKTVVNTDVSASILLVAFTLMLVTILLQLTRIKRELKNYADDNLANYRKNSVEDRDLIPCKKCCFYDNNGYLKCAVNPTKVLKTEARECSDYCSQSKKLVHANTNVWCTSSNRELLDNY